MKVEFNPVTTSSPSMQLHPIRGHLDETRYQSLIRGMRYPGPTSLSDLFSGVFRIFTFIFHFLFVSTPKLSPIFIPDLTPEKKANYEQLRNVWFDLSLHPKGRLGPSWKQQIQLLHQFCSFKEHLEKWKEVKNGNAQGILTIDINGKKQTIDGFSLLKHDGQDVFLKTIADHQNYIRGKEIKIVLSFKSKCAIDRGFGPFRVKYSTLTCTNTLGADGKTITIEQTDKKLRSRYSFFPSSANAPLK